MPPKGGKESPETREKRIAAMLKSPAVLENIRKVNERNAARLLATKMERNHRKAMKRLKQKRRIKAKGRPSDLLGIDSKGNRVYDSRWYSTIKPEFTVVVKTLMVIKYGRPRDPWGAFMKPKDPALLFGRADLHPEQRFVLGDPIYDCNPDVQTPVSDDLPGPDVRPSGSVGAGGPDDSD